jgi:hypothetical protein
LRSAQIIHPKAGLRIKKRRERSGKGAEIPTCDIGFSDIKPPKRILF